MPILAPTADLGRRWAVLLSDLLTRVVAGAAGSVAISGSTTVGGNLVVDGAASVTGAASVGGTTTLTGTLTALGTAAVTGAASVGGRLTAAGGLDVVGVLHPATPAGAAQSAGALYVVTGAPNNAQASDGDVAFRTDGGAGTAIYQKRAGAWVGIA